MSEWVKVGPAENRAYLATPASGSGAGVLVLHAWWGLTPDVTDVCDRFASEGYLALAPDLFRDSATADTIAEAEALVRAHDGAPDLAKSNILDATDFLLGLPGVTGNRIAVIGYSLGAYWALHLSQIRPADICAAVTVYGTDDGDYSTSEAAYLGHFAEHDDFEPLDGVQALADRIRKAGHDVTFHVYPGTGHWFVEPSRTDAYNAEAASLAWDRTLAFLSDHLA